MIFSQNLLQREQQLYRDSLARANQGTGQDLRYQDYEEPRPRRQEYQDITNVLEVDKQIMNFSNFMPGRQIAVSMLIVNKTDCEQIIELGVDEGSSAYRKEDLMTMYPETKNV
jgi:hypothetical protein